VTASEPSSPEPSRQVQCAVCAVPAEGPPATWSAQTGARGTSWLCERCTRDNLRSIEGRLDEAWW
jgi:hypothetical protein